MAVLLMVLSVNLDSLGVGFSYGVRGVHIPLFSIAIISCFSILYSSLAIFAGSLMIHIMPLWLSKTLGVGILLAMGVTIIVNALRKKKDTPPPEPKSGTLLNWGIKSLGITISVVRDPSACDFDRSKRIDAREAMYLGLALSVDAIGVGLGSALGGITAYYIPLFVGLSQLVLLSAGLGVGRMLSKRVNIDQRVCGVAAGALLIVLALLRI